MGTFLQQVGHRYDVDHGLPGNEVQAVDIAPDGTVWAGTSEGLAVLIADPRGVDESHWREIDSLSGRNIRDVAAIRDRVFVLSGAEVLELVWPVGSLATTTLGSPRLSSLFSAPDLGFLEVEQDARTGNARSLWIASSRGLFELDLRVAGLTVELRTEQSVSALAIDPQGSFVVLANVEGVYTIPFTSDQNDQNDGGQSKRVLDLGRTWRLTVRTPLESWGPGWVAAAAVDQRQRVWIASHNGLARTSEDGPSWRLWGRQQGLPLNGFTSLSLAGPDEAWAGTRRGLVHLTSSGFEYRQGKRWLPHDDVRDLAVDQRGQVWAATAGGVGHIELRSMTLESKADLFETAITTYHRRTPYGYVDGVYLPKAGDLSEWQQHSSDNDGLWTAMYGAAQCFSYAATRAPGAARRARQAYEALRFLGEVTQGGSHPALPGFVARSILPTDGPDPNDGMLERDRRRRAERDGKWKVLEPRWPKSADGRWYWKGDTSSDELDGHFFFYALYFDLVADAAEQARVAETVTGIVDHLIEHDFSLIDHDGLPTRWAVFGPKQLNFDRDWWEERGLNSLSMLSYLRVAEHTSGEAEYGRVARELIDTHGYAQNVRMPKAQMGPGTGNQSDDEMALMGFYNLMRYEKDPELREIWAHSLWQYAQLMAPERNPLFNLLAAALLQQTSYRDAFGDVDTKPRPEWIDDALDSLLRYPLDRVDWPLENSHRLDVLELRDSDPTDPRGYRRDGKVLPIDERFVGHWNHDPWRLDYRGQGHRLADGTSFLLPYYLGLHHGLIVEKTTTP